MHPHRVRSTLRAMLSRMPKIFWIGFTLFVIGSGPLLAIILAAELGFTRDPNPNPIGPGILAGLTFWPAVILMIIGLVKRSRRGASTRPGRDPSAKWPSDHT